MRALFVTRKWPPAVGGMETYSEEVARELARRLDLTVRALPGRANGQPPSLPALVWFLARAAAHLAVRGGRYDVLHLCDPVLYPLAWLNRRLHPRCRNVVSAHGTDVTFGARAGLKPALYRRFLGWAARAGNGLDAVVANSSATRDRCLAAGFRDVAVVPLGVRADGPAIPAAAPQPYLLFVGRLVRRKGAGWFIREVLPRLPASLTLKIAGTVWDADEEAALGDPRVEFLGPVFGEALAALRREALATVMPNLLLGDRDFEGFGLTAPETARDGGILLAAAADGIVDAVEDGVTGFLLPPGDAQAWSAKILDLAGWPQAARAAFALCARARVEEHYSWERVGADLDTLYRRLLACDPAAPAVGNPTSGGTAATRPDANRVTQGPAKV